MIDIGKVKKMTPDVASGVGTEEVVHLLSTSKIPRKTVKVK